MENVTLEETWIAMEELVKEGLVKNIGVSNFEIADIQRILKINTIPIACNQYECHPYFNRSALRQFCESNEIVVAAHSSLGSSTNPWADVHSCKLLDDPTVNQLAVK